MRMYTSCWMSWPLDECMWLDTVVGSKVASLVAAVFLFDSRHWVREVHPHWGDSGRRLSWRGGGDRRFRPTV